MSALPELFSTRLASDAGVADVLLPSLLVNSNPKGCNQYTGPGCSAGGADTLKARVDDAYARLYGDRRQPMKDRDRQALVKQYRADLAEWQGRQAAGGAGKGPAATTRSRSSPTPAHDSPEAPGHLAWLVKQLDRSHNRVHLADLRAAVPAWDRAGFDGALDRARRQRLVTLEATEGRAGITDRDRDAAVVERDSSTGREQLTWLTHVSLRRS